MPIRSGREDLFFWPELNQDAGADCLNGTPKSHMNARAESVAHDLSHAHTVGEEEAQGTSDKGQGARPASTK